MAFPSFFSRSNRKPTDSVRWFAGISITAACQRIESAMIGIHGHGSGAPVEVRKTISFNIPREITDSFNHIQESLLSQEQQRPANKNIAGKSIAIKNTDIQIPAALTQHVTRELTSIEEEAIQELISESRLSTQDILAIGVHDTGLRLKSPQDIFYQGLCDAPFLAEQTGMNIVDAFPAQDIAVGGNGGPLFPLPAWIYLKSETHDRILIDLGRSARLLFLPAMKHTFSHLDIRQIDVMPCGSLLDTLVWQITGGKTTVDTGGRFAVQGCQVPKLMSNLRSALPAKEDWTPSGLKPDRYLQMARRAAQEGLPHQDVLCTVSGFIAETVAEKVLNMLETIPPESRQDNAELKAELLIQGAGQKHGLLMNNLSSHLCRRTLLPISQLGIPDDTFDALCTAMLTSLTVDRTPGNLPTQTGSEAARPLGRITAGAAENWQRLLNEMAKVTVFDAKRTHPLFRKAA